jgi:ribosome-associated heat shock protein Hsp15
LKILGGQVDHLYAKAFDSGWQGRHTENGPLEKELERGGEEVQRFLIYAARQNCMRAAIFKTRAKGNVQFINDETQSFVNHLKSFSYENGFVTGVRIDKWLWAARFFKTRSLAGQACDLGRIEYNGHPAKASREVRVGDRLQVKNEAGVFQLEVVLLSEMRGPAAVAQALYLESEASKELRLKAADERKTMRHLDGFQEGRPSKRDRRTLNRLRGRV